MRSSVWCPRPPRSPPTPERASSFGGAEKTRRKPANRRKHTTLKCFLRHCGISPFGFVGNRNIHAGIGVTHEEVPFLEGTDGISKFNGSKCMEQTSPAH